jgi:NAD/NADP transhydrogenase beta subunit
MNEFHSIGKLLILVGVVLVIAGMALTFWDKIPLFGKLPGDIAIKGKNFTFYFPIVTCIILSIIISLILYLFKK